MFSILYKRAWEILQENRTAYIVINILFYGLVMIFMIYAVFDQPLQSTLLKNGNRSFATGILSIQGKDYGLIQILQTIGTLYIANLLGSSFGVITFPSFVIPFFGLLTGVQRAVTWGLMFSPAHPDIRYLMIPHSLTLFIEGQAYILAMLGAYIHGRAMIWPASIGVKGRWTAYVEGVRQNGTLYMFIMVVLAIVALYQVIEAAIIVGFL